MSSLAAEVTEEKKEKQQDGEIRDLIYLAACALHDRTPDPGRIRAMDLDAVLRTAKKHMLSSAAGMALARAGVKHAGFAHAVSVAVRRAALFSTERDKVLEALEQREIWHMPLKGSVLGGLYPRFGMREMSDVDILFDSARARDVRECMEGLGYTTESFGEDNHDVYTKKPSLSFEMHRSLFHSFYGREGNYYRNVYERLLPVEGSKYGRQFTPEDFYLFLAAHEYKHFMNGGTGLRSVADNYIFLSKYGKTLDMHYIGEEAEKLGIAEYERTGRMLALHLFGNPPGEKDPAELPDKAELAMLSYIAGSGAYGRFDQFVESGIERAGSGAGGKLKYVIKRLGLSANNLKEYHPVIWKTRVLVPFWFAFDVMHRLRIHRKDVAKEIRILAKHGKNQKI